MAIVLISGPEKSGKSTIANALRNDAIRKGKGCLLYDDHSTGELPAHFEKIVAGGKNFDSKKPFSEQQWKSDPQIVLVGDVGNAFYMHCTAQFTGFKEFFGPVYRVMTGSPE